MKKENVKVMQLEGWDIMLGVDVKERQETLLALQAPHLTVLWDFKS